MNNMHNILKYLEAIPRITQLLAKYKIDVHYSGESAYTVYNNKTHKIEAVNLPSLPSNVSEKVLDLTMGFMFHELGHVNHSDFTVLDKMPKSERENKGFMALCNILEDTLVERKIAPTFLEAKKYLAHCRQYIIETTKIAELMGATKEERLAAGMIPTIRYLSGQLDFYDMAKQMRCPELEFLWENEEKIKNINSSQDVIDLARVLYKDAQSILQQQQQNDDQNQDNQKRSSNGSGQGNGRSDGQGDSSSQDQSNSDQNNQDNKQDNKNDNGDGNGNDKEDGKDDSQNGSGNSSFDDALDRMNQKMDPYSAIKSDESGRSGKHITCEAMREQKKENGKAYTVATREYDEFYKIPSGFNPRTMEQMKPNVNIATLKSKLLRLFAAKNKVMVTKGLRSGKLCGSNLYRLKMSDDRVFKRKQEADAVNTAITLLVDLSGSMSGSKARCATSAAYLFSEILDSMKIPYEVLGFSTNDKHSSSCSSGGRQSAVKIGIFKSFNDAFNTETKGRFCYFYEDKYHENYMNCNADGDSILMAQTNLMKRPEQRKLMFVLSDGYPSCYGCDGEEVTHLKQVVKAIEHEKNMEIYGIGIQSTAVKEFYTHYSVLDKPEQLSNIIIEQLSKNLL